MRVATLTMTVVTVFDDGWTEPILNPSFLLNLVGIPLFQYLIRCWNSGTVPISSTKVRLFSSITFPSVEILGYNGAMAMISHTIPDYTLTEDTYDCWPDDGWTESILIPPFIP